MGLIYFLEEIFGKIVFAIGEYEFAGIRPVRYLEVPWKNRKEMKEYFKELEIENTTYSYKKFVRWEEEIQCQKIHINFSRYFLFLVGAIIFLFFSGALIKTENQPASIIFLTLSIIMFLLSLFFNLRAKKIHQSLVLGKILYEQFETWPE
ncbi:MAG TPA: hypothetical protein VJ963_07955 [Bacteroidales bacterium]|nr:hypothetical protein [Bacteroidales bacterium]